MKFDEDNDDNTNPQRNTEGMYSSTMYSHQLKRIDINNGISNSIHINNDKNNNDNNGSLIINNNDNRQDAVIIVVPSSTSIMKVMLPSEVGTYKDKIQTLNFIIQKELWCSHVIMIIEIIKIKTSSFPVAFLVVTK